MIEIADVLEAVVEALEPAVADLRLSAVSDADLAAVTAAAERVGRLVDGVRALAAGEVGERSRRELGSEGLARRWGHARAAHLLEQWTGASGADVGRRIRVGSAVRERIALDGTVLAPRHPRIAEALRKGTIGLDAAEVIVRCLDQAGPACTHAVVTEAESALVAEAQLRSADLVAIQARMWREALDPDGARPREEALRARRAFRLGREREGMTPFSGALDPVNAALVRAVLTEHGGPDGVPRFLDERDRVLVGGEREGASGVGRASRGQSPDGNGGAGSSADGAASGIGGPGGSGGDVGGSDARDGAPRGWADGRSREQRQLDILLGLIQAGVRVGEVGGAGARPTATVVATMTWSDLLGGTGTARLDAVDEPVSALTARELACDAGVQRLLLGVEGEPLVLGRRERLFTPAQRRALAARDGGCIWPGCTAPPAWCHAHHVRHWADGGATDVDNGTISKAVLSFGRCLAATDRSLAIYSADMSGIGRWRQGGRRLARDQWLGNEGHKTNKHRKGPQQNHHRRLPTSYRSSRLCAHFRQSAGSVGLLGASDVADQVPMLYVDEPARRSRNKTALRTNSGTNELRRFAYPRSEPPQVFCRCYAGCGSSVRAA